MYSENTTLMRLLDTNKPGQKLTMYLPTNPASSRQTLTEDGVRFRNALRAIVADKHYDAAQLGGTMKALEKLADDTDFWHHRTSGLLFLADADGYEAVSLTHEVTPAHYIGDAYVLGPLVALLSLHQPYYALEVNFKRPRLLSCDALACEVVNVDDMPESYDKMVENMEFTNQIQHQSAGIGRFHGHSDENAHEATTQMYYRAIAHAVDTYLQKHTEPLVLVGTDNRVGAIRKLLKYQNVLEHHAEGSSATLHEHNLHALTAPMIHEYGENRRDTLREEVASADPARVAAGVQSVHEAAAQHRVKTVALPSFRMTTDTVRDGFGSALVLHTQAFDADIERLIREVIAQAGEVVAVALDTFSDRKPHALYRF